MSPDDDQVEKIEQAERALRRFRELHLDQKNLFWMAGVSVDEDQWSDVLAYLLDPRERHGLESLGMRVMRDVLVDQGVDSTKVRALESAIPAAPADVSVTREFEVPGTRPDIVVQGPKFTICIENKKLNGSETMVAGDAQTVRQERWLKRLQERGQDVLGILLNPGGMGPQAKSFVCLDTGTYLRALKAEIARRPSPGDFAQVLAFLELLESTHT